MALAMGSRCAPRRMIGVPIHALCRRRGPNCLTAQSAFPMIVAQDFLRTLHVMKTSLEVPAVIVPIRERAQWDRI